MRSSMYALSEFAVRPVADCRAMESVIPGVRRTRRRGHIDDAPKAVVCAESNNRLIPRYRSANFRDDKRPAPAGKST